MTRYHNISTPGETNQVIPFTAEEEAARDAEEAAVAAAEPASKWAAIRAERDALLASTDWRAMPDAPTMSADWTNYRQALRDLPSTESDPDDIVFPTEPT